MTESAPIPPSETGRMGHDGRHRNLFAVLSLASLFGYISSVPLGLSLANPESAEGIPSGSDWISVVSNLIFSTAFTMLVMAIGFRAGDRVRLGWSLLAGMDQTPVDHSKARRGILLAVGVGLLSVGNALLLEFSFESMLPEAKAPIPNPWFLLLASMGAAINEEILCRIGFMTIAVWIFTVLARQREPGTGLVWSGIFLSSLGFASLHLPQTIALYGDLTAPLLAMVILGNGIPGLLFGWLYWRTGIAAAMIAHFTADFSIYVLIPALST